MVIFFNLALAGNGQTMHYVKYMQLKNVGPYKITSPAAEKNSFSTAQLYSIKTIPADYYTQHFGFFCKKELAVEKFTKIPFRFRLGSLEQCNYYEGKK